MNVAKFPKFFVIIDIIAGLLWKLGSGAGKAITSAGKNIKLMVGKVNLLAPISVIVQGFGNIFVIIGFFAKIIFFIALIITIIFIIRFIVSKIKYKKMMRKVESMPDPSQSSEGAVAAEPEHIASEATAGGPRELHGF